ncbi:polyphosphate kinase 2 [uncultured Pseudokineococcus sp.]|uniref:polyphosphate kinase 2 n=1 Tax=uncultured Pseudokineococcus sp. TaxID=1642928 RepID=UPI00261EBCD2|nr:polyphosphate kinase 2 [uncultured Pseudokineococcus sp.]
MAVHEHLEVPPGVTVVDDEDEPELVDADGRRVDTWREGYPYAERMRREDYAVEKRRLQIELLRLQRWMKASGERLVVLCEGRDAAGKGGTLKRFTEHLNPRGARVVALEKPSERESTQWYFQRYVNHLPAAGEMVFFDRSWYTRAGVERVMGFASPQQYDRFMAQVPLFEQMLADDGIHVVKFWFSVTRAEQRTRFLIRQIDPVRQWKLSPMDIESLGRWDEYTRAKEEMFARTDLPFAPWVVVSTNDKKRARLEAMRVVLSRFPYDDKDADVVGEPDPQLVVPASSILEVDRAPEGASSSAEDAGRGAGA